MGDRVDYLSQDLVGQILFDLKNPLYHHCTGVLHDAGIEYRNGGFITVNSVSGYAARGQYLQSTWHGLCENMEGAAVAQVCSAFSLDFFELRTISNMVEDRDVSAWKLEEACIKVAETTSKLLEMLNEKR
jgi:futalosine hydrolase